MGVKIFSLDETLGIRKPVFDIFGVHFDGISQTCGVILWPFVFIMTDIINEYFGVKGVRFISWIAAIMISYAYLMLFGAMHTAPAGWWVSSSNYGTELDFNKAYLAVFGQGTNIIIGSLIAFMVGQLIDVSVFHWVKKKTGEKFLWLRSTGSTLVSQLIDSFIVLFVAFYLLKRGQPGQWSFNMVLAVGVVNYIYKVGAAFLLTPVIYLAHKAIDNYLGLETATKLRKEAVEGKLE
ncbi:MAG TPA: queuosine precursor transporter [Chitinophagales bacterium]|nr:queuosine precursor transporter [Chitinophagales bacterium]